MCKHYPVAPTEDVSAPFIPRRIRGDSASLHTLSDEMQNLFDALRCRPSIESAVDALNDSFLTLRSMVENAWQEQGRGAQVDNAKILTNLRAMSPRINRLATLMETARE